jgi:uncharacterized protein with HEPN domain
MRPELLENLEQAVRRGHEVQKFVAGLTLEQYSADDKTRLAVERSFEIIGEALNRSFKIAPEQIESIRNYRQIISFRNILAHCYDTVEDRIVWGIIEGSLPELLEDLKRLLCR